MNWKFAFFALLALSVLQGVNSRKTRARGSSGSSSRRSYSKPVSAPAPSHNYAPSAPKANPPLFGWQTANHAQPSFSSNTGVKPSHSYPSSGSGLSGSGPAKQAPSYQQSHSYPQNKPVQQNIQQSHSYPSNNHQSYPTNNQPSHGYPQSPGLSGSAPAHNPAIGQPYGNRPSGYPHPPQQHYPQQPAPHYPGYQQSHGVPPPPYSPQYGGYHGGAPPVYGGHPSYGAQPSYGGGLVHPGYGGGGFGGGYHGGVSKTSKVLAGVGIAGATVGTVLSGLALWNLAHSSRTPHNTYSNYDSRGQPERTVAGTPVNPLEDPFLKELINCTLTISSTESTEVVAIPCVIATSIAKTDVKDPSTSTSAGEEAKCTITVVKRDGTELSRTIPCSTLVQTAKDANVTEPPPLAVNGTDVPPSYPQQPYYPYPYPYPPPPNQNGTVPYGYDPYYNPYYNPYAPPPQYSPPLPIPENQTGPLPSNPLSPDNVGITQNGAMSSIPPPTDNSGVNQNGPIALPLNQTAPSDLNVSSRFGSDGVAEEKPVTGVQLSPLESQPLMSSTEKECFKDIGGVKLSCLPP